MSSSFSFDVAVVGAGIFGACTADALQRRGRRVLLVDGHGVATGRASSGGETRLVRVGYGPDELYTRWAIRALEMWKALARDSEETLFHETGVLWLAREPDVHARATGEVLAAFGVRHRRLTKAELRHEFPQMEMRGVEWGLLEIGSGVLMARRAVEVIVRRAVRVGMTYRRMVVSAPPDGSLPGIAGPAGERFEADVLVFACGAWLPRIFPDLLGERIRPTRQEVFFFGVPAGDTRFAAPALPAWVDFGEGLYGVPEIEGRGVKIALHAHGPDFDPETGDRTVSGDAVARMRDTLAARFPALKNAPLVESRVCQYENTSSGDFLIDRHPQFSHVWIVGGGSGHGFKHGPVVGEHVARLLDGTAAPEPRFALAGKGTTPARVVY